MTAPAISIIMSAYNAQRDISRAIESILAQTFTDFEFIIINDGSTDQTGNILRMAADKDPRIIIHTQVNVGLTKALNTGLKLARAPLIARQDCDDWSAPERLQRQYDFMNNNPDIGLCGSLSQDIYEDGTSGLWRFINDEKIMKDVFFKTPFPHSSVMMRKDIVDLLGGYDETFKTSQDMELWMRFARATKIAMINEALIWRYIHSDSISQSKRWRQTADAFRARIKHAQGPSAYPKILYYCLRVLLLNVVPASMIKNLKEYWRS